MRRDVVFQAPESEAEEKMLVGFMLTDLGMVLAKYRFSPGGVESVFQAAIRELDGQSIRRRVEAKKDEVRDGE